MRNLKENNTLSYQGLFHILVLDGGLGRIGLNWFVLVFIHFVSFIIKSFLIQAHFRFYAIFMSYFVVYNLLICLQRRLTVTKKLHHHSFGTFWDSLEGDLNSSNIYLFVLIYSFLSDYFVYEMSWVRYS